MLHIMFMCVKVFFVVIIYVFITLLCLKTMWLNKAISFINYSPIPRNTLSRTPYGLFMFSICLIFISAFLFTLKVLVFNT